jgi:hypothetical protein
MGKLIDSMRTSLDGYTEDEQGRIGNGVPILRYGIPGATRGLASGGKSSEILSSRGHG